MNRVFKLKVDLLLDMVCKKHVLGRCDGYCYTIEWQKVSFVLPKTVNLPQIVGGTHVQPNDPRLARLLSVRRSLLNGCLAYSAASRIYICW